MKLTILGAAGEVTGSSYLVETATAKVLVDCGLHQGEPEAKSRNQLPPPFDAATLTAVVLTHAHLDHTGRLPLLTQGGFRGPIFGTAATGELTRILLKDAASIQQQEAEQAQPPTQPLFTVAQAEATMMQYRNIPYYQAQEIAPGIRVRLRDAGHILGSASIEMKVSEGGREKLVVFSGDVGPMGAPILRDPDPPQDADLVLLESTYGDRDHPPQEATVREFQGILKDAERDGHRVLVPAFAVGRAQQLLYHIAGMYSRGELTHLPVYLDSPMGIAATELYAHHPELFDPETRELFKGGRKPFEFPKLQFTLTGQDSRTLNGKRGAMVIIAGSGMANAGRIVHHLKFGLGDPSVHVVFTGFQAKGTLGRDISDGLKQVRVMGQVISVAAQIHVLRGFSAHAGQTELVAWMKALAGAKPRVLLTHGEQVPREALRARLLKELPLTVDLPRAGDQIDL